MKKEKSGGWKVLESEYLFCEPWFTVRRDKLQLPNGKVNPAYYVLEYPDWVNVIAVTTQGEFIFVEQYRHGLGVVELELCAGVTEQSDASPEESARRELMEETGYGGGEWQHWMTISANPSTQTNLTHCFLATGLEKMGEQHLDETEYLTVHLLSPERVRELLEQDAFKQALHAAPLWKYAARHLL